MPKEESLLLVGLHIHGDQRATRGEEDYVLIRNFGPLEIQTFGRRVADYMFQLHDWVLIELGRSLNLCATVLSSLVRMNASTGSTCKSGEVHAFFSSANCVVSCQTEVIIG